MLADLHFNDLTHQVIGAAIEVHRILGPGLLESIYAPCLHFELATRKIRFATQRAVPIVYKGSTLDTAYRIDLAVEDVIVVELKSVDRLVAVHQAQVLTYCRLLGYPAGLVINFNEARLIDGVKRVLNPAHPAARSTQQ